MEMSKKRKFFLNVLVLFTAFFLTAGSFSVHAGAVSSGKASKVTIKIKKKNVTKKTVSLKKGENATLKISVSRWKGKKKISYQSSDKKIASVTSKGVIKAKKAGTAKIKVTVKGDKRKATAWVKVKVTKKKKEASPSAEKANFNFKTRTVKLNSGYKMPINGLGTYSLHGEECVNAVKAALSSGVRLIDTASAYGNEKEVGQAIREAISEGIVRREDVFVITKIYPGSEMARTKKSIQACLNRLNIGYVDMMLLHHPDENDVKAYKTMEQFAKDGKIRSLGLSNWYVEELEEFLPQVTITPALVQNEIHPYYQENDVIPYIQDLGIVVQGWYPLGGRGHTAELLGDSTIKKIAAAHGVTSAQVILRWNLQKGVVVIPGSSNPDHIKENLDIFGFDLTDDEIKRINALDRNEKHDWY